MFQYIKHSLTLVLQGEVDSKEVSTAYIEAYPDADLAGDYMCAKSTSGYWVCLRSGKFSWPLSWGVQKQGSTAQHTQEAEIVSFATVLRSDVIPIQELFAMCLGRPITVIAHEDNNASLDPAELFSGVHDSRDESVNGARH